MTLSELSFELELGIWWEIEIWRQIQLPRITRKIKTPISFKFSEGCEDNGIGSQIVKLKGRTTSQLLSSSIHGSSKQLWPKTALCQRAALCDGWPRWEVACRGTDRASVAGAGAGAQAGSGCRRAPEESVVLGDFFVCLLNYLLEWI